MMKLFTLALTALCLSGAGALAQTSIGNAAVAVKEVRGTLPTGPVAISEGDTVYRNEAVRTGADSHTRLVFLDNTDLSVGPQSSVTLDKFVYSGDGTAAAVGINLAKGAFRFATGASDKKAYDIRTPVATIGVRGTILDIRTENGRTTVVLIEGQARVCIRNKPDNWRNCTELMNAGDRVVVSAGGLSKNTGDTWSFALNCSRQGLCERTQVAGLVPDSFGGAVLCGR